MRAIFVTGTDTGVGKTYVCGLLLKYLKAKGINAVTQKWVQTGCRSFKDTDVYRHFEIACLPARQASVPAAVRNGKDASLRARAERGRSNLIPYIFKQPVSPHLAAKLENRKISKNVIKNSFKKLCQKNDFIIVEGSGGILVPLSTNLLMVDLVKELRLPVLIVAQNKLGAINHTLLTIETLRARKIEILGVVFNNLRGQDKKVLNDNPKIVARLGKVKILAVLPWDKGLKGNS